MQLNREAMREYETASSFEGQVGAIERMGGSNVGESIDLVQNVDYAFILGRSSSAVYNEADEETLDDDIHIYYFTEILSTGCMYHAIHLILSRIAPMQEKEIKAMLVGRKMKNHTMSFAKIKKMAVEINKELASVLNHTFDELKNEN